LDLSLLNKKTKRLLFTIKNNDLRIKNNNHRLTNDKDYFLIKKLEKDYKKKYKHYMNKELNSEIILMFYKYIIISKVIPIFLKNNAYFITELLEIIPKLLISVIDLITFTLIFDKLGWVKDGQDPWMYIYFLFSAAKKKTSSNYNYSIIMNELNKSNYGFSEKYKKWMSNSNIEKILYNIKLDNINKRYIELKQPIHLNQHHIKFIN